MSLPSSGEEAAGSTTAGPPGAGGTAGIGGLKLDQADFKYPVYIERMVLIISMNWFKPAQSVQTSPVVHFQIERDGTIAEPRIVTSSGLPFVDRAALRAVHRVVPAAAAAGRVRGPASRNPGRLRMTNRRRLHVSTLRTSRRGRSASCLGAGPLVGPGARRPPPAPADDIQIVIKGGGERRLAVAVPPLYAPGTGRAPGQGGGALHGDAALGPRVRRAPSRSPIRRTIPPRLSATRRRRTPRTAGSAPAPRSSSTRAARSPATGSRSRPASGT